MSYYDDDTSGYQQIMHNTQIFRWRSMRRRVELARRHSVNQMTEDVHSALQPQYILPEKTSLTAPLAQLLAMTLAKSHVFNSMDFGGNQRACAQTKFEDLLKDTEYVESVEKWVNFACVGEQYNLFTTIASNRSSTPEIALQDWPDLKKTQNVIKKILYAIHDDLAHPDPEDPNPQLWVPEAERSGVMLAVHDNVRRWCVNLYVKQNAFDKAFNQCVRQQPNLDRTKCDEQYFADVSATYSAILNELSFSEFVVGAFSTVIENIAPSNTVWDEFKHYAQSPVNKNNSKLG